MAIFHSYVTNYQRVMICKDVLVIQTLNENLQTKKTSLIPPVRTDSMIENIFLYMMMTIPTKK